MHEFDNNFDRPVIQNGGMVSKISLLYLQEPTWPAPPTTVTLIVRAPERSNKNYCQRNAPTSLHREANEREIISDESSKDKLQLQLRLRS
eukprot:855097-Amphidinium_carterae.1